MAFAICLFIMNMATIGMSVYGGFIGMFHHDLSDEHRWASVISAVIVLCATCYVDAILWTTDITKLLGI